MRNAPTYLLRQHSAVKNINETLLSSISKIQYTLGLSDEVLNSLLEIRKPKHEKIRKGLERYSVAHLYSFCDKLGISMQGLFEDKIDLVELHSRFVLSDPVFPER